MSSCFGFSFCCCETSGQYALLPKNVLTGHSLMDQIITSVPLLVFIKIYRMNSSELVCIS